MDADGPVACASGQGDIRHEGACEERFALPDSALRDPKRRPRRYGRFLPREVRLNEMDCHCEERSDEAIHTFFLALWIASRSLSSGARSRDPVARTDRSSNRQIRNRI